MAESAVVSTSSATVRVPLRSDPSWLRLGLLAVTVLCVSLFAVYFRFLPPPRPPVALALLPGFALATFAGAGLAWWGRRRGGTMYLEAAGSRLLLRDGSGDEVLIDWGCSFGAVLLVDTSGPRRVLLLTQGDRMAMVLDLASATVPTGRWKDHTIQVDLSGLPLAPSSSHVFTLATGHGLETLLSVLEPALDERALLLSYRVGSGSVLDVTRMHVQLGARRVSVGGGTTVRRIEVEGVNGDVTALSIAGGEGVSFVFACQDPSVDAVEASGGAVDGYLPALVFVSLAAVLGMEIDSVVRCTSSRPYRG